MATMRSNKRVYKMDAFIDCDVNVINKIKKDKIWNTHIINICTKANQRLGFLRRNLYACPQEVKGGSIQIY